MLSDLIMFDFSFLLLFLYMWDSKYCDSLMISYSNYWFVVSYLISNIGLLSFLQLKVLEVHFIC